MDASDAVTPVDDDADDGTVADDGAMADDVTGLNPVEHDIQYGRFSALVTGWTWFSSDETPWSRRFDPFDFQIDGARWLAAPTADGAVRCRVENDDPPGNAGIYTDPGRIGQITHIEIDTETVHSDSGEQEMLVTIYLDIEGNGDYFEWESESDRERFVSLGNDAEITGRFPADETVSIDSDTAMDLIQPEAEKQRVTLGELQRETVEGVTAVTGAAIQVSVVGSGSGSTEEIIVHNIEMTAQQVADEAWAMANHDFSNTSSNGGSFGPKQPVEPRWEFDTDAAVRSSPAVVDGTVYVGSDDGHLYAIETSSGDLEWSFETEAPIESSPAVMGQTVYVGSDDGHLYAVSVHTGEKRWEFET